MSETSAQRPVVVTPDAVGLDLEVATVGSRAVAYLLDLLLLVAGFFLLGIAEATFGSGGFVPDWFGIAILLVLLFAWQFGYPIGFETLWRGRTIGKAAMGLRVVTVEGGPVGVRHATIRATVALFELTATLGAGALISSFVSGRGQRLGDLAAGTMVVRERRAAADPRAEVFHPPAGLEPYVRQIDASGVGAREYAAIRDMLRRAPQLPVETRTRVTRQLAETLLSRVTPPPPAGITAEAWLACVAAAVQTRPRPTGGAPPVAQGGRPGTPAGPPVAPADPPGPPATPAAAPRPAPRDEPGPTERGGFAPPG